MSMLIEMNKNCPDKILASLGTSKIVNFRVASHNARAYLSVF